MRLYGTFGVLVCDTEQSVGLKTQLLFLAELTNEAERQTNFAFDTINIRL